jgi:antitoxin (DNA-binding transcriptional repressor) of toxin-antitoxin stability system
VQLTWPYGHGYVVHMKTMAAGKFKDLCLKTLDEVARTKSAVVITKRGRPVAKLVPCGPSTPGRGLAGSVLQEKGDPFSTGERWDADPA